MRQIKFRAWDKETRKMFLVNKILWGAYPINPFQVQGIIVGDEIKIMNICDNDCENNSPHCELMQSTGLKDRNGKEIYEGDIVKGEHLIGEWIAKVDMLPTGVWYGGARFTEVASPEIIGNIYQNPELLTNKE